MSKPNKLNYRGSSKVIAYLASCANWLLDNISNVAANPSGTATDDLTKLQVGDTIYNVAGGSSAASGVSYDNTTSGLTADNVQEAIDEVQGNVEDMIPLTQKGVASGVAELDSNGKVPSSQLPSYVDDVVEYNSISSFPAIGVNGKIYIDLSTNLTYRWSGSEYVEISPSLALGETSATAYRGDRGKIAYDHSQTTGNPHGTTKSDVGLGNVPNVATNDQTPTFTEASTRANITSGETLATIMGKIKKFFTDLKTVAFTGSYTDLTDKPTIPAAQVNSDWNASSGVAQILNKPNLATVATSGSYNDLSNKPTIPTVNNATLTIQKNGTNVQTFTANQSTNATANITVPTKTSELTNDSGYTTNTGTVTKVSTGNGLAGGDITTSGTIKTYVPRVEADSRRFVGGENSISWEEYSPGQNHNLPTNDWYHVISMQGEDTRYGTQLALAMTNNGNGDYVYYRRYQNSDWSSWISVIRDPSKLPLSGGTMTGSLTLPYANFTGGDIALKPYNSSSNDSSDIVWFYGNGNEKARLWTENTYTSSSGLNYRVFSENGTQLYNGKIPLQDTTYNTDGIYLTKSNSNVITKKIYVVGADTQYWVKICEMEVTNQYGYCGVELSLRGEGRTDGYSPYIHLIARIKQQSGMNNNPTYELNVLEWAHIDQSSCRLYLTSNTSSLKKVEIWIKSEAFYQSYYMTVLNYAGSPSFPMYIGELPETSYTTVTSGCVGYAITAGSATDSTKLPLAGGTMTGTIDSMDIKPKASGTYSLGNDSYRYNYVWSGYFKALTRYDLRMGNSTYYSAIQRYSSMTVTYGSASSSTGEGMVFGSDSYHHGVYGNGIKLYSLLGVETNHAIYNSSDEKVKVFSNDIESDEEKLVQLFDEINISSYKYKYSNYRSLDIGINAQELESSLCKIGINPDKYNFLNRRFNHFVDRSSEEEDRKFYLSFYCIDYSELHNLSLLKIQHMERKHKEDMQRMEDRLAALEKILLKEDN